MAVQFARFLKSHHTTNAHNMFHLHHCTHGHASPWTVARFQRSWSGCERFNRDKTWVGEVSCCFQIEL